MTPGSHFRRWPLFLAAIAVAVTLVLALQQAARRRAVDHWRSAAAATISASEEQQAARMVRELVPLDVEAVGTVVSLLSDRREPVADAAMDVVFDWLASWERLPPDDSAPRIQRLALELAAVAPQVPPGRRQNLHDLAARLIVWPLDAEAANAPQVLANCELVLRLPLPAEEELRLANVPQPPLISALPPAKTAPPATSPPKIEPIPVVESRPPAEVPPPFYGRPAEPERLIDASRERPEEPRQIRPPKAIKIEG